MVMNGSGQNSGVYECVGCVCVLFVCCCFIVCMVEVRTNLGYRNLSTLCYAMKPVYSANSSILEGE